MTITIAHLFPNMLNLYGDRGNLVTLRSRLERRGVQVELIGYEPDDKIDYTAADIIYLGGGTDREQQQVCERLRGERSEIAAYVADGRALLAVCGSFPMLGQYYKLGGETVAGLEVLGITTGQGDGRQIGNIVLDSPLIGGTVVGFENHSGLMDIGDHQPLGKVISGFGNDGKSGVEGVVYQNVIATYLHGPLLPKNPALADHILRGALERKYGTAELAPLDDALESQAHAYMVNRCTQVK